MRRTPEQIAADEALTEALANCARAYDLLPEGEVIMDYGCSVYVQSMEMIDNHQDGYLTIFKDSNTPTHSALGLFKKGVKQVLDNHGG